MKRNSKIPRLVWILLGIGVLIIGVVFLWPGSRHSPRPDPSIPPKFVDAEPVFKKEGTLTFLESMTKKEKARFDIEIADSDESRTQGLMFRKSMKDEQAMLFLFDYCTPQSFWMKNTHISLDIIYVNDKKEVVSIQKNTIPFSEESLPSYKPAQYVVEVKAGISDRFGIREGDAVIW